MKKGKPILLDESLNHDVDILVTGVGAVPSAYFTTRFAEQYQFVINLGIAGSYNSSYPIGSIVCVKEDAFGDYGIDDRGTFRSLFENRLIDEREKPFQGNILVNPYLKNEFIPKDVPMVKGITLATASGSNEKINQIKNRWNPDIETMEGAAVFYVCNMLEIPFICIRAISNMVEPRDRSKWEINRAVDSLTSFTREYVKGLSISL